MSKQEIIFDLIVVGGGGAGLAAAIEARECGASVLLLEKNQKLVLLPTSNFHIPTKLPRSTPLD